MMMEQMVSRDIKSSLALGVVVVRESGTGKALARFGMTGEALGPGLPGQALVVKA